MNTSLATRILLPLLAAACLALAAPRPAAAAPDAGDYVALQVPDLPRAERFFRNVLNCVPLDAAADTSPTVLLDCGRGTVVSLTEAGTGQTSRPTAAIDTTDALAAAAWLRANHVALVGRPVVVSDGPDTDETVVTFLAPWGQPLRLVSHAPAAGHADLPGQAQLAAQ